MEDEKELIERAKNGEAAAFGSLYDTYLPKIYRFVLLKVSHREEAEDLTHQAFLKAWENVPKYRDEGFPFSSWLYRIARNTVIDHYRSTKHSKNDIGIDKLEERIGELPDREEITIDARLDQKIEIFQISTAIKKLKDVEQDIIIMRFVDDLPHEEVARVVGKSVSATKLIQHRAIKKIKDELAKTSR